ncbi:MAG: hypothetical protein JWP42_2777, partial [Pseudomonas sp.]|nr:hypothetical protein [Pseudomonas sp.]
MRVSRSMLLPSPVARVLAPAGS